MFGRVPSHRPFLLTRQNTWSCAYIIPMVGKTSSTMNSIDKCQASSTVYHARPKASSSHDSDEVCHVSIRGAHYGHGWDDCRVCHTHSFHHSCSRLPSVYHPSCSGTQETRHLNRQRNASTSARSILCMCLGVRLDESYRVS